MLGELEAGAVGQFQEALVEANYSLTTDRFLQLLRDGQRPATLVRDALNAAAPFLTVPSHVMVNPQGEFMGVNYDHCVLGLRASHRMVPYLPRDHQMLSMAQAVWYMPQGLDVWDQLLCEFPGHYARDDKHCGDQPGGRTPDGQDRFDGPTWTAPKQWFQTDHAPIVDGTVPDRLNRFAASIMEGDKQTAYQLSLGLHAEPDPAVRRQLESQLLFCGIIDLQETLLGGRKMQNIGHKALRARALVHLAEVIGWEHASALLYCVVPDIATMPRLYTLFDLSTQTLGMNFRQDLYTLKQRNDQPMTEAERDAFVDLILHAGAREVTEHITALLRRGKALIQISDTITAAFAKHVVDDIWSRRSFFQSGHAYDYSNVVSFWLRSYNHPHQAKAPYFQGLFINDVIKVNKQFPQDPTSEVYLGDWREHKTWADSFTVSECLGRLIAAVEDVDAARAEAITRSYLERTSERRPLMEALAICSSKFQNDPHQQRNAATSIEEWELTTATKYRDTILIAWAKYIAGCIKRTTALDCTRLFEERLGKNNGSTVIAASPRQERDQGVMGMTLAKPAADA